MRQDKTTTINGVEYTVHQFGARESLRLSLELTKRGGPFIALFLAAKGEGEAASKALGGMIRSLVDGLDSTETVQFVEQLLSQTEAKGSGALAQSFDEHFTGDRLGDLVPVLKVVVEHNFKRFFLSILEAFQAGMKPSPSLQGSTGSSGAA